MSFRIKGLDPQPFSHLFGLSDAALHSHNAIRYFSDDAFGYPDRVELRDALPGERVLLVNHTHLAAATPYRSSHAIFVREGATKSCQVQDQVPEMIARRLISLRAFGEDHMMIDADITEGRDIEDLIHRFFAQENVSYLHAHFARRGCYAALITRS